MSQPTPARSTPPPPPPRSQPHQSGSAVPPPPQNVDSAPFAVLVSLFEKLSMERKQDRRKKMINSWFTVC